MSLLATSRPQRERNAADHVCPRCGRDFTDQGAKWLPDAPCADCREYLVHEEGHSMDEWRRRPRSRAA